MRPLFFIVILFCFISKPGFCELFHQLDSTFRKASTLQELKTCFSKFQSDTTLTSAREEINRSIDFNYTQVFYSLRWEYLQYKVYLVARNDTIVLGKLEELDYFKEDKMIKSTIFRRQDKMITTYLDNYFSYYQIKVSESDFIKNLTTHEEFGFACGLHRTGYTEVAKKAMKYVNSGNYNGLSEMLRSPVPEIKAYGARGLIELEKKGLLMKDKEKTILAHYKEMNFMLYSCYGCLSGPESFQSILEYEWPDKK